MRERERERERMLNCHGHSFISCHIERRVGGRGVEEEHDTHKNERKREEERDGETSSHLRAKKNEIKK